MDPHTPQEPRRSARLNPPPPNPVVPADPDNPAAPTEYQRFRAAEGDGQAQVTAETQAASDAASGMNRGEEDLEAARVAAEVVRAGAVSAQQQEDGSRVGGEGVGDDGGAGGGLDVEYDEEWPDETTQWMQALEFMRQEMETKLEQQRRDLSTQTQHMMDVQTERMMSAQTNLIRNMFAELRMGSAASGVPMWQPPQPIPQFPMPQRPLTPLQHPIPPVSQQPVMPQFPVSSIPSQPPSPLPHPLPTSQYPATPVPQQQMPHYPRPSSPTESQASTSISAMDVSRDVSKAMLAAIPKYDGQGGAL
ncbi:hypothetical protein HK104_010654 [Borealophlyctis nickersoniae]|nr:hypothetical protein HK104_010654 [Borealophlyctis nickersoniae]